MSIISQGLLFYAIAFLGLIGLLLILDKVYDVNHGWSLSKARLMCCSKCRHVFLVSRHQKMHSCPKCGAKSEIFRMPRSGMRNGGGL